MNMTEQDPCALCSDPRREPETICVVATPSDLIAIDRGGHFRGRYHVLHGLLSPLEGIGPDDIRDRRAGPPARRRAAGPRGHHRDQPERRWRGDRDVRRAG